MNNIPFITIILAMTGSIVALLLGKRPKTAHLLTQVIMIVTAVLTAFMIPYFYHNGGTITYMLGHFPAPWGNELRFGLTESILACVFSIVMFLAVIGGRNGMEEDIQQSKQNCYDSLLLLVLMSLLALIYTNDIFTAYVFIEINTIASCGIVMVKESGETLKATIKYLFMSLMASGLFLISVAMLYAVTGHLLIPQLSAAVADLSAAGSYTMPLMAAAVLMTVSLGVKSAMFPFHTWLPDAHSTATTTSSSILSGVVVKGYIILLIKIYYRVFGIELIRKTGILHVIFVLGLVGMIMGSVFAIREHNVKRMIAYSSVAQIGYIYAGIGLGTWAGLSAALFHMIIHAFTKPLLFSSAGGLIEVSGHSKEIRDLTGAGHRNKWAAAGFIIGACSMVGVPLFGGFTSKVYLAISGQDKSLIFILALALSSCLNAIYYMPVALRILTGASGTEETAERSQGAPEFVLSIGCFSAINIALGICGLVLISMLMQGVQIL
ncbi:MAG: sodium:proton antiporter [Lachnospiraceae bacterium]|nr:sodium:proton antiporter [Lachnospiraceae bacterium]